MSLQIRFITQLLETDKKYYASIPTLLGHAAKYYSPDMYMRINDELESTAQAWQDPEHMLNYVKVFLEILKKYYKFTDNRISAHLIANDPAVQNRTFRNTHYNRRKINADTHTLNATENTSKCVVCQREPQHIT